MLAIREVSPGRLQIRMRSDGEPVTRGALVLMGNLFTSVAATAGAGTERVLGVLRRLVKGSGLVVKTRAGLTTFGEGLTDDEVRHLHALVRRALAGTTG